MKLIKKNSVSAELLKNYIVIFIIAIITFFLSQGISNYILSKVIYNETEFNVYQPKNNIKYPYDGIDANQLELTKSWIEILDENLNVVIVKGNKQDSIYQYQTQELFEYASYQEDSENYPYYYEMYPIKGPNNEAYLMLWKLPKSIFTEKLEMKVNSIYSANNEFMLIVVATFIGVFLILFSLSLYLYTFLTAKYFKHPITHLVTGIREMQKQNFSTRLNFKADKEFAEIKDAFNNMAELFEKVELEKRDIEDSKQQMLMDVSHDLKTPITSIYGFSKLLTEDNNLTEVDQKRYLSYIYQKSQYVYELIKDLFQFTKLQNKSLLLNKTEQDLAEWFRQVVSEYYPQFESENIKLNINISNNPIIVYIDSLILKRAIVNILDNVLKYNPNNTEVYLSCKERDSYAEIMIADNGIGINDSIKDKVFEPFFRADSSRRSKEGTGLGLAIVKQLIDLHEGSIELTTSKSYKTEFIIKLPLGN